MKAFLSASMWADVNCSAKNRSRRDCTPITVENAKYNRAGQGRADILASIQQVNICCDNFTYHLLVMNYMYICTN